MLIYNSGFHHEDANACPLSSFVKLIQPPAGFLPKLEGFAFHCFLQLHIYRAFGSEVIVATIITAVNCHGANA
jgi:hypothetical protein